MTDNDQPAPSSQKPAWRRPVLTEDPIVSVTANEINSAGDDGLDKFPGYESTGIKS